MRNFKFTLAYDGTDFHGWQVQPDRLTIQGALADGLRRITGESVMPQGSGRTDAGVHALGQVASCAIASSIPAANLMVALNDVLPAAIRVLHIEEAPAEFHARKSARGKSYQFRIFRGDICPPFLARYVYHHPYPLDEQAMVAAAAEIVGERDFTSLAAVDPERREDDGARSNVRTVFCSQWQRAGDESIYTVRGSGFLHHMVRNLVGMFVLIGKGSLRATDIARILQARNRSANPGATAPASGLYLVSVEY
ncbi:MAG: tRNA pseudouridine(38-40) synthase TruA [Acidobacteriia bacterium]|nr:tRNA pseudouridine(38-40) synthase TruA [Terriglobia bacterium]